MDTKRPGEPKKRTVAVLVENKDGVLARVAGLFYARGYDIESICLGQTLDPSIARMTLVVRGDAFVVEGVVKQLDKLIDVIKVADLTTVDHVEREMVLLRVAPEPSARAEVLRIADLFRAKVVDIAPDSYALEATGEESKINAMLELLRPFSIHELVRTGKIAIARRPKNKAAGANFDSKDPLQRRYRRHPVAFEVRLTSIDELTKVWTEDISKGGMSVQTDLEFAIGATVQLRLVHPRTGGMFPLEAVVRRQIVRPTLRGFAVEFVGLDEGRRGELGEFIRSEGSAEEEYELAGPTPARDVG